MKLLSTAILSCILFGAVMSPAQAQSEPATGTVAETIDVGSYVYLRLEESDMWIAAPAMAVSEGDQVEHIGGMEMRNFYSKALDRTFESIWFIQNVRVAGVDLGQVHQGITEDQGSNLLQTPEPITVAAPAPGEIEKLSGGKTIAEITADPATLQEQAVSLRARVIKVSANIMGKNWVTLQDGTGTAPSDKLLATSLETATVGETVTVQGVVRNDVDLGSGYRYEVLLEEATFSR